MSFAKEFKAFAMKGNVMDLAVGVIIGAAFGKIVSSLVDNILMPIIGAILQGVDFKGMAITVGKARITYGLFIGAVIDFITIALVLFFIIKGLNKMTKKEEAAPTVAPSKEEVLLTEIRDLLKK